MNTFREINMTTLVVRAHRLTINDDGCLKLIAFAFRFLRETSLSVSSQVLKSKTRLFERAERVGGSQSLGGGARMATEETLSPGQ